MINNHILLNQWNIIIHYYLNVNGGLIKPTLDLKCMIDYIPYKNMDVITYACPKLT